MKKLYVVGIGPGGLEYLTPKGRQALEESQVIVGYEPYLGYVENLIKGKETFTNRMGGEIQRIKKALEFAQEGKTTSIISTGDAGVYGMASPVLEEVKDKDIDLEVIPGVASFLSAAAELGAPLSHDFVVISLSDWLTDYDLIKKRVDLAGQGDFVLAILNPRSKSRPNYLEEAVNILLKYKDSQTPVGIVRNSGRDGRNVKITRLSEIDYKEVDMLTLLIVGNSTTYVENGKMITPRGYK